jgi:hypothetical protein
MPTANTEAATVKAARAAKPKTAVKADPTGNVTGATVAPGVGTDQPARNYFMLGDPDEPRAIIEASDPLYGPILGSDYVVAPEDALEEVTPRGCITSTTRQVWCRGQHVPIERFYAHYGKERADELIAAAEAARQPAPEVVVPVAAEGSGGEAKQPENPPT